MKKGTKKNIAKITLYMLFVVAFALFPFIFTACADLDETPFERRVKTIIILCGTIAVFIGFVVFCAWFAYSEWIKEQDKGEKK